MYRFATSVLAAVLSSILILNPVPGSAQQAAAAQSDPAEASAASTQLDDPTIVAIFDAANSADIETGRLAAERGHDPKVRDFGAMLARDHEAVRQQGRDLAGRLGVTPTPPADDASAKAHAAAMKDLRGKRGAAFDRAFLRHEATFHQNVIQAIQGTLLPAIQNQELKSLVLKIAPAFRAHLLAAEQLARELGHEKTASTSGAAGAQ
jgi:putative membrane protein